ncbi:MAG TPA: hypothetical protein VF475_14120 [Sphingobium sp.]
MRLATAAFLGFVIAAVPGMAQAATPDITGMWNFRYSEWGDGHSAPAPSLTPAADASLKRHEAAMLAGHVRGVSNMKCLPVGFPGIMLYRTPMQIMAGFGRIDITAESSVEPRTIYLGKAQPDPVDPSWNGHSVGHWEGDTLVVDTVGLNGRARGLWNLGRPMPETSESAHFTERMRVEDGGKVLSVTFTVTDPVNYAAPYSVTVHYDRMPDDTERMEAVCEVDLDALAAVDLKAIKDVDAEAARMLDPDLQYNPTENGLAKP